MVQSRCHSRNACHHQYLLVHTFDRLTESEQQEIALEILKRVSNLNLPPLSDDKLVLSAEVLFIELDRQEVNYE
ncbi:MAG: hypothetical protein HC903_15665 [Methylacidiphilales bacterium]|nr:hypothetical protein [Candidatus Methylacidiphilales bacterium]NJR14275.1 hypothetical protein [Calothrix sp. CSU_2_0]